MSTLYRVNHDYATDRLALHAGAVVDLDDGQAGQINRDSTGTLTALTGAETAAIDEALAAASAAAGVPIRADWRPGTPPPPAGYDPGEAMHSGNMWGAGT